MTSRLPFAVALLALGLLAGPASRAEDAARARVDSFHAALIHNMQLGGDFAERHARLAGVIDSHFHLDTITRISIGRSWSGLDAAARNNLKQLLRELIITTYVQRFRDFNGQDWRSQQARELPNRRALVKTRLNTATGNQVSLDYQLRDVDGNWAIFDIIANGVSDLSLRRATYSDLLRREGMEGLQQAIRDNIDELLEP